MAKEPDEQGARILENLRDYYENPEGYCLWELEDIFEDRDPFEFL